MEIQEVTVGLEKRADLGNFEGVKPQVAITASVEPKDDADDVMDKLEERVRDRVEAEIARHKQQRYGKHSEVDGDD